MIKRIHHIDYVVRDLDRAVERYCALLDMEPLPRERLQSRGIEAVRFKVGEIYLILVQPVAPGPVQAFLDAHGEGFFHIAYLVENIEMEAERLNAAGISFRDEVPRRGLEGWKLMDIDSSSTFGVLCQLVEEVS